MSHTPVVRARTHAAESLPSEAIRAGGKLRDAELRTRRPCPPRSKTTKASPVCFFEGDEPPAVSYGEKREDRPTGVTLPRLNSTWHRGRGGAIAALRPAVGLSTAAATWVGHRFLLYSTNHVVLEHARDLTIGVTKEDRGCDVAAMRRSPRSRKDIVRASVIQRNQAVRRDA